MPRTSPENVTIISSQAYEPIARKVAAHMGRPFTEIERSNFKDGEIYHRLPLDEINRRDVVIISGTHDDAHYMETIDLIEGAKAWHAESINLVVPYLGYSTMERAKKDSGEIPKGMTRTRRLLRQPLHYAAFVDLHAEGVIMQAILL